jgi:hypothetical protein
MPAYCHGSSEKLVKKTLEVPFGWEAPWVACSAALFNANLNRSKNAEGINNTHT